MSGFLSFVIYACVSSGLSSDKCFDLYNECRARHKNNVRIDLDKFCANSIGNMSVYRMKRRCE